jgi:hypothetical protein
MLTAGTLNLPAGEMRFALQRLVAMRTVKLEFRGAHRFYLHKRKNRGKSISKFFSILFTDKLRLI